MTSSSSRPGMGAQCYAGGVTFRVWAPHATGVWVVGSFPGGVGDGLPLGREEDGCWSADVPGASRGDRYRYRLQTPVGTLWRNDPYALEVTHSAGDSIVTSVGSEPEDNGYRTPGWHEMVIYELHVGTFNDEPGGGPGTFESVVRRLDYLRDLGVNVIELMPSAEFGMDFSWGYNPAHIFAIEQAYGGPERLRALVQEAHARGIAVVFDVVYNHLGPSDLDLWRFDGWSQNGKGGIYFYNDDRSQTPWGDTRPDYGRPEVRRFLGDNATYWLEDLRLDGLRWDATGYIRNRHGGNDPAFDIADGWRFMQEVNQDIGRRQPWKIKIAEDLQSNPWLTRDVEYGGAGFDTQWDPDFVHPVRKALTAIADEARDVHALAAAVTGGDGSFLDRVIYTESHDEVANGKARLPEEIWPGNAGSWAARKRSTLGAGLVFTSPGIPMIFAGQEILEDQWFHDQDPVDWTKEETYAGILQLYRDLIRLRRNWYGTTRGLTGPHTALLHLNDRDKVLAYHRWDHGGPADDVVIVVNAANRRYADYRIGMPRGGLWRLRLNSDWAGYSEDFGSQPSFDTWADGDGRDVRPFSAGVAIGPYSVLILSQDS